MTASTWESDVKGLLVTEDGRTLGLGRTVGATFNDLTLTLRWPAVTTSSPGWTKAIRFQVADLDVEARIRRQELIPGGTFTATMDIALKDITVDLA